MRGPSPKYVLCHEHVVHGDDVDLVNALRLEFVVLFDVSWCLRMTRGREGSRHANLSRWLRIYYRHLAGQRSGKGERERKSSVCVLSDTQKKNLEEEEEESKKGWGRDMDRAKAHIVRTNMFLPEGASVIGLVASSSLTFSFSGSLSPGFTWVGARSAAAWAWAVCAARFTRVATAEDIL
jgi:hypothetical protein